MINICLAMVSHIRLQTPGPLFTPQLKNEYYHGPVEPGPAAVIGIVGIGLIGASGMSHIRWLSGEGEE